jgi:hypothetical protein
MNRIAKKWYNSLFKREFCHVIVLLMFFITSGIASAFQDIYEPDDSLEQARLTIVGGKIAGKARQQNTLHSLTDEDWFKFYAMTEKSYRIEVNPVGIDIDVAIELYDSDGNRLKIKSGEIENEGLEGEEEFFSWIAPSEGFYYVKVSDVLLESENCRKNIQYELRIFDPEAPTFDGKVQTVLIDAISGQAIEAENAMFNTIYKLNHETTHETTPTNNGNVLQTASGANDLIARADGYKSLTCYIDVIEDLGMKKNPTQKNMPLLPDGVNIPDPSPSKAVYLKGETLHIEFQASLPPNSCIHYYFGIAYPDGRFFIIKAENQLEPFNPPSLPRWESPKDEPGSVLVDQEIDNSMPSGEYQLYTLRISEGIEDIVNNLERGELSVGQFRIE